MHSRFSQIHKVGNVGICANFVLPWSLYLQFFEPIDVSKYEIGNQGEYEDYISSLYTFYWTINSRIKTTLAMLAFLYCEKF